MPLTPYELLGHDEERLAFRFSMLNDDQVVLRQISDAALDELLERRARSPSHVWRSFFRCAKKSNKPPHGSSTKGQLFVDQLSEYLPGTSPSSLAKPPTASLVEAANDPRIAASW